MIKIRWPTIELKTGPYKSMPQVEFICELLGIRNPNLLDHGLRPNDRRKLESALKGVNVEVTHRKSNRSVSLMNRTLMLQFVFENGIADV